MVIFPPTIKKLFNFPNKVRPSALESPLKPVLISAKKDISQTCSHTAVLDSNLVFKASMRILLGILIGDILFNLLKKHSL